MKKLLKTPTFEEYSLADCEYWFRDKGSDKKSREVGYFSMIDEKPNDIVNWETFIAINLNFEI